MANGQPPPAPPWVYQQPADIVQAQITAMSARADSSLAVANTAIADLINFEISGEGSAPPPQNFPNIPGSTIARPDRPTALNFGDVGPFVTPPFEIDTSLLSQIDAMLASLPNIGQWVNPIPNFIIPAPPGPMDLSGRPVHPDGIAVDIPNAPVFQNPQLGALIGLNVPSVPSFVFPEYEDIESVFHGTPVQTVLNWAEPTYQPLVLNELSATIRAMLAGDFIMPAIVQAMLFDQNRANEDTTALKATQEAFETWAGRGHMMPPGMLVEAVSAVQQQNQLTSNARAREILTKSAEWEIQNLRDAVEKGITLESKLIDKFMALAQRTFDAAKARLDADVAMFTQYVALYNATQAARNVQVEIFKAKLTQITTLLEAYKAQLEGEQIKNTINEQTVRIFTAQISAVTNIIEQYKALMQGAQIKSEINKNIIDGFKADVEAYAARLNAEKTVFEAYEAQMKGVEAQGRVVEASARAFEATAQAQAALGNVKIAAINGKVAVLNSGVQKFVALTEAEKDLVTAQATGIDAKARAFMADCTRFTAELGANTEETRLSITIAEARLRNLLAYYETRVREYDQSMTRVIERGRVIVSAISSAGGMASQNASGAMAAMHVQASLSGSGNAGTSWSDSRSFNENHNFEDE